VDLLRELEHREPGALDHRLQDEALDERIGERGGHRPARDRGVLVVRVDEDRLEHPGRRDEVDEVGLGDGAAEGLEALADAQVLPVVAVAERRQCLFRHAAISRKGPS
jgi:hypothetical protein